MSCKHDERQQAKHARAFSRRALLQKLAAASASLAVPRELWAGLWNQDTTIAPGKRFPYFQSNPISYLNVKLQDRFWAPRQKTAHDVSVQWITSRQDQAGGLEAFKKDPQHYVPYVRISELEHVKFIESMATVIGVQPDPAIAGLIDAWARPLIVGQGADGYLAEYFPVGVNRPEPRWHAVWWSHEDFEIGNYLEAAIAYREVTGKEHMYRSAVRAADNMVVTFLGSDRAYAPGHEEIEQALMRLYGITGDTKYLRLSGWLIGQRGHHDGRQSFGRSAQDQIPVKDQRTIEGHAVRAAFLFNGVTQYVGATGDAGYREAVLAVWDDFVNHKMYLHGAGGNKSARNEGYRKNPYCIPPDDTYGESCAVFGNFQWAHNLFHLTGDARYIDTAERMLYNAFYASLSLKGDSSFYCNVAQTDEAREDSTIPIQRSAELATSCCPPNIVKLFCKVGGFFYSTDPAGVFVKHYGASEAVLPFGNGLRIVQQTDYPWQGRVVLHVVPTKPTTFTLRLRVPRWAKSFELTVNGKALEATPQHGWLAIRRHWMADDQVDLTLPMEIERVTMPPQFEEYKNRAALQRGPIVYCLEEQDVSTPTGDVPGFDKATLKSFFLVSLYIPEDAQFTAEHVPDLLGGVTVLKGAIRQVSYKDDDRDRSVTAVFVPYGVWGNRGPGAMRIWLGAHKAPLNDSLFPDLSSDGESCVG